MTDRQTDHASLSVTTGPDDQSLGKPGKVMELQSGQGKVRRNHDQCLQANEGKHTA